MTATLPLLTAPNLKTPHGCTTRAGGVSSGHFGSLNLGLSTRDDPDKVAQNRERVLAQFGTTRGTACALEQVHSARVIVAEPSWYELEADASITDDPNLLLIISVADCQPLLFHDPMRRVVGAAHAGWRGTVQGIAGNVVQKLQEHYGSDPQDIRVALGASIQGACYQVGAEVVEAFDSAGFPSTVYTPDDEGRYRLDLTVANRYALHQAGVPDVNVFALDACTHCDPEKFYSHRRDGLKRGSHWAVIKLDEREA